MSIRENLKFSQRLEYGAYQFLDHFLTRKVGFAMTGNARRNLYKRIRKTLEDSGKGRILEIDRRKDLSIEELKNEYIKKGIPVVMEGKAKDWDCVKNWSLDYFNRLHGKDEILVIDSKRIENPYEKITLSELIENIREGGSKYYRFYPLLKRHPEHLAEFDYPWLKKVRHRKPYFETFQAFIGGKGTQSPLHNAMACNFFIQVYGQKRWSLISPKHTAIVDPDPVRNVYRSAPYRKNEFPFDPFNPDYGKPYELFEYIDRYELVLNPGDILWNPPFWWHSVINETDSIGVGYRWVPTRYSFKQNFFYAMLDYMAFYPPFWKGYKMSKEDVNLIHLADGGHLKDYEKGAAE